MIKVVAEVGNDKIELVAVSDEVFGKIMDGDCAFLVAIPTMYRASNPREVWPLPGEGVKLRYD